MRIAYQQLKGTSRYNHRMITYGGYQVDGIFIPLIAGKTWRQNAHRSRKPATVDHLVSCIRDKDIEQTAVKKIALSASQIKQVYTSRYRHREALTRMEAQESIAAICDQLSGKKMQVIDLAFILIAETLRNKRDRCRIVDGWKIKMTFEALTEVIAESIQEQFIWENENPMNQ